MYQVAPIAHVIDTVSAPHLLDDHLRGVGNLAALFASDGIGADWARVAGIWHDLGKYSKDFQDYIRGNSGYEAHLVDAIPGRVNHSSAGALHALAKMPDIRGRVLAYLIAGHHAGLADWAGDETGARALEKRMQDDGNSGLLHQALVGNIPEDILSPALSAAKPPGGPEALHLWMRLLFSCLVDADFLDTEQYMSPDRTDDRKVQVSLPELLLKFNLAMEAKSAAARDTPLGSVRADILQQCRERAREAPGIFTLTVPTGGGKTLSSLAFALEHAKAHDKRRVIYAIPYTSIIEQTADVFRGIFGDAVLEHHSNFDPDKETPLSRLASENWDAPLIVTTNVQLFESLFAARTSRCRKLHNLVNSVIVLDEAQLLPPEFLQPILKVMRALSQHYGVTFVLCTATQPALKTVKDSFAKTVLSGLDDCREIMADPQKLYDTLQRVELVLPADLNQPVEWPTLAAELQKHPQVLVIVNTRKHCRELFQQMPAGSVHLSALMCGEHRSRVIASIRQKLKAGEPVRVISTQLIEAGVDVDFPVVYRALAGLDSIAQAAGRCNREGKQDGKGKVFVFIPPASRLLGLMKFGEQACRSVLYRHRDGLLEPARFREYFAAYYGQLGRAGLDKLGICDLLESDAREAKLPLRTVADKFQLIDESQSVSVVVPYRNPDKDGADSLPLILQLKAGQIYRELTRKLQRYTVTLRQHEFDLLRRRNEIEEPHPGYFVLRHDTSYHGELGLLVDDTTPGSPEKYVV